MNRFLKHEKDNWQRLEDLLGMLRGTGLKGLSRMEVREFGELYRRAAADLAIARAETRDPKLIGYLNNLVIRAHGQIYRAENRGGVMIWEFFSHDFPRTVRENWKYVTLAAAIFFICAFAGFYLCASDRQFAEEVLGLEQIRIAAETNSQWWLDINEANQLASSGILTNNILVSIYAFAMGAFFGIGAVYVLAINGVFIGGVLGTSFAADPHFAARLGEFMVGHGVIELSCIFLAAGAGMMIGYSIVDPGDHSRSQAVKIKGMQAAKIIAGCAVLLVLAGVIEGFLSPSDLPAVIKYGTGIGTGIALYGYFLMAGRPENTTRENSVP